MTSASRMELASITGIELNWDRTAVGGIGFRILSELAHLIAGTALLPTGYRLSFSATLPVRATYDPSAIIQDDVLPTSVARLVSLSRSRR